MSSTTIVVQKFEYTPDSSNGTILEVSGRSAGIMGWILHQLKLGTESSTIIRQGEVEFQFSSLSGIEYIVCPFSAIRCVEAGVSKPLWQLIVGFFLTLGALGMFRTNSVYAMVLLAVGIGLAISYFLTKNLVILFSTGSMGQTRGLAFSSTVLSGKKVDLEMLLDAIGGINKHLVKIHSNNATGVSLKDDPRKKKNITSTGTQPVVPKEMTRADIAFREGRTAGKIYEDTKDKVELEKARDAFLETIRLDPEYVEAYRYLAVSYKHLGKSEEQNRYMTLYEKKKTL